MSQKITLLIIDPQIDFCDPAGALYVPNAEHDMHRLAEFIRKQKAQIEAIHVTLDSHHLVHIAHPIFWQDSGEKNPTPFTTITADEVEKGRWKTSNPALQIEGLEYVRKLEKNARYSLTIWPPHCLIGSRGLEGLLVFLPPVAVLRRLAVLLRSVLRRVVSLVLELRGGDVGAPVGSDVQPGGAAVAADRVGDGHDLRAGARVVVHVQVAGSPATTGVFDGQAIDRGRLIVVAELHAVPVARGLAGACGRHLP